MGHACSHCRPKEKGKLARVKYRRKKSDGILQKTIGVSELHGGKGMLRGGMVKRRNRPDVLSAKRDECGRAWDADFSMEREPVFHPLLMPTGTGSESSQTARWVDLSTNVL